MKESGLPVIGLAAGEPDFDTPDAIVQAGCDAIRGGFTRYSPNTGTASLRAAVCDKLERENGVAYAPNEIVLSNGAKQSVAQGVIATCGPGDEVLIPAPYWVSYPEMCRLAGAEPVVVPTTADEGFVLSAEKLRAALTPTRGFILSPFEPSGAVYSEEALRAIAEVVADHRVCSCSRTRFTSTSSTRRRSTCASPRSRAARTHARRERFSKALP